MTMLVMMLLVTMSMLMIHTVMLSRPHSFCVVSLKKLCSYYLDDFDDASYFDDDASGILDEDKEASFETCLYHYMGFYLNEADVKEALHIPSEVRVSIKGTVCSMTSLSTYIYSSGFRVMKRFSLHGL